jgi:hypothetical protein
MNCETFSQMLLKILEMKILEKACISCQWREEEIKENGGGGEFKYNIFDIL